MKKITLGTLAMAAAVFAANAMAGVPGCDLTACPPSTVPEPGTLALLAAGIAGVVAVRLIKRK